jgi:5'-AMP-activated protein kinase regulatory gamma subunit
MLLGSRLEELLQKPESRGVVVVPQDSTVDSALQVLAEHRILSAPVTADGEVLGFVDIRDILAAFLKDADVEQLKASKMLAKMRMLEEGGAAFARKSLRDLGDHGSDGGFLHANRTKSLSLLELIYDGFLAPRESRKGMHGGGRSSKIVHRLAVFNKAGDVEAVVSQSDVIRYVAARTGELGPLAEKTTKELGWAQREVLCTAPDVSAFEAMLSMSEKGISALAVVAEGGKLIGNFSLSELRTIMADHFGSLALPVGEFLALEHGTEYHGYIAHSESDAGIESSSGAQWAKDRQQRGAAPGQEVGQQIICCGADTTFAEVLQLLTQHRLHRLYVVDQDTAPIGLITLTDVLRRLCNEAGTTV